MDCIIVRRGDVQTYDRLYQAWEHLVPVIWDRRCAPNRPVADADTTPNARHPIRRRKPPITWTEFGYIEIGRPAAWRRQSGKSFSLPAPLEALERPLCHDKCRTGMSGKTWSTRYAAPSAIRRPARLARWNRN